MGANELLVMESAQHRFAEHDETLAYPMSRLRS